MVQRSGKHLGSFLKYRRHDLAVLIVGLHPREGKHMCTDIVVHACLHLYL